MSEATKTNRSCEHCGSPLEPDTVYCSNCGAQAPAHGDEEPRDTLSGAGKAGGDTDQLHAVAPEQPDAEDAEEPAHPMPAQAAEPDDEPAPSGGIFLDWPPELVAAVEEAAELEELTTERFIHALVEPAALRILESKKGLVTLDKAADMLGVERREIIQMITDGKIRARKVEDEWKVEEASLDPSKRAVANIDDQIELDLRDLAESSGLMGVDFDGDAGVGATMCYVNQAGVLVCPRRAWRKLGRERIVKESRDAVRRYMRRRDHELGRI